MVKVEISTSSKIAKLREYHEKTLESVGAKDAYFYPKMAYKPRGKEDLVIGMFPSELKKETDIYTEFVSKEYEPEDPDRSLYKWSYNPYWESEYEKTEINTSGQFRYLIPIAELEKIERPVSELEIDKKSGKIVIKKSLEKLLIKDLNVLDLLTILYKKPLSSNSDLNDLITKI
jgi:hypothetical protein